MTCKNIRNCTGGLSELQSKIVMVRGFTNENNPMYQREFSEQLNKPLSTINYNIMVLKKKGLLTYSNYLTPDGKSVFLKLKEYLNNTRKLRAHRISGTFILREPYRDFEGVRDKYTKISKSPKHRGFRVEFENCLVLFYSPKKVFFYLPDVYGNSFADIDTEAYEKYIAPLKSYLEQLFENLQINEHEIASIQLQHVAYQNHSLAEVYKKFNVEYKSDRLQVDHSHGVPELETIHKKSSVEDMDKILDYEKLVRGPFSQNK